MRKNVTVVILAGGVGKRFWPFLVDKSTFPVLGESLILYNVRRLAAVGFPRFVIVTNAANDAYIRSLSLPNVEIRTVIQKESKGMGDALLCVRREVAGCPVLVVNAEDIVDESLYREVIAKIRLEEPFVVGRKTRSYFDGGYIKLSHNRLTEIVEKPGQGKEPSNLVNLVFHYFPYADIFLDRLTSAKTKQDDLYELALSRYAKEFLVSVLTYDGFWTPLKYPWQVLDIMSYLLRHNLPGGRGKNVEIRNNVILEGAVYIGSNVKIFENTKIVGPAYIGDNTIIGNNNIIRESMIGNNCVTGFNTDITRSYVGNECWFHSNYVGDSVLEENISMGSGSVLANLRLDDGEIYSVVGNTRVNAQRTKLGAMIGRDVRIGVNASIMPGVKIGTNSCIGAGVTLDTDVAENSFCIGKTSYEIRKNTKKITASRDSFKAKL